MVEVGLDEEGSLAYMIQRDGKEFGPYSLADIQRYLGTGNILLQDLARAEDSVEWVPVAQILGSPTGNAYAPPIPAVGQEYMDPPNLHWALVLLLGFFTCGIFVIVWDLVQALWVKKIEPGSKALFYYVAFVGLWVINMIITFTQMGTLSSHHVTTPMTPLGILSSLISLVYFVLIIVYRFSMRRSLEEHFNTVDPVGLSLGPVMTFFFGGLYFQYHFNRINAIKRAYRMANPY